LLNYSFLLFPPTLKCRDSAFEAQGSIWGNNGTIADLNRREIGGEGDGIDSGKSVGRVAESM
jgi:hypothetical protein